MSDLKQNGLALLSKTIGVDMKTAQKNTLYTVPPGKVALITGVIVMNPSASMAGGIDYDLGTGVNADTWKQTNNLSSLITLGTDSMVITSDNVKYGENAAGAVFGIKVITGTTAACTADILVIGIEVDA